MNEANGSQGQEGTGTATTSEGQGAESGQPEELSEYASHFLSRAPKEHQELLSPYVKQWDSGVTRRIQGVHDQYAHYADLDWDPDTTQQMAELYRVINEEPERLYQAMHEMYGEQQTSQENVQTPEQGGSPQEFQGLPKEFQDQWSKMQQVVEHLAQGYLDTQKSQQEAQEDAELDEYLESLTQEFGEFDEDYVLALLEKGVDGADAVTRWQQTIQEHINAAQQTTAGMFPTLSSSGGGAVPVAEQQNLGKIPSKDIVGLIKNVLSAGNQH